MTLRAGRGPRPRATPRLVQRETGRTLAAHVTVAAAFVPRLRGWIGRRPGPGDALWLPGCACVHTCGMLVPIDVIWCGGRGVVLRVDRALRPWRIAALPGAAGACELPAGAAAAVLPGHHADLVPAPGVSESDPARFCYNSAGRPDDGG